MERVGKRQRDIRFFSPKNQEMVCVHSRNAKCFADTLEKNELVKRYQAGYPLDEELYINVNPIRIRTRYFTIPWATDFFIEYEDGTCGVYELATSEDLKSRAFVERLEFSRRYWDALNVTQWKVALFKEATT